MIIIIISSSIITTVEHARPFIVPRASEPNVDGQIPKHGWGTYFKMHSTCSGLNAYLEMHALDIDCAREFSQADPHKYGFAPKGASVLSRVSNTGNEGVSRNCRIRLDGSTR